jgi:hypothetical protein
MLILNLTNLVLNSDNTFVIFWLDSCDSVMQVQSIVSLHFYLVGIYLVIG